jgi:hypothetical protein
MRRVALGLLFLLLLGDLLPVFATEPAAEGDRPPVTDTANGSEPVPHPQAKPLPSQRPTSAELAEQLERELDPPEPPPTLAPNVRKTVRLLKLRKFLKTWLPFLPIP